MFLLEVLFPFPPNVTVTLVQYWLGAQTIVQRVWWKPSLDSPCEMEKELNEHAAPPWGKVTWPTTACSLEVSMNPKQKSSIVSTEKGERLFSEKCFHVFPTCVVTLWWPCSQFQQHRNWSLPLHTGKIVGDIFKAEVGTEKGFSGFSIQIWDISSHRLFLAKTSLQRISSSF